PPGGDRARPRQGHVDAVPHPRLEPARLDEPDGERVVGRRGRKQVERARGDPPSAGLLARVRRVEDGDRRAVVGQVPRQERAPGTGADDGDLHPRGPSTAASTSAGAAVAVPSLPTTTPAAWLASIAASASVAPAPRASPTVAMTVSPAPVTSKTSRAAVGRCTARPPAGNRLMPCSPRVTRT